MKTLKPRWAITAIAIAAISSVSIAHAQPVAPKPAAPAAAAAPTKAPGATIVFLDRGTVLRTSLVGVDMYKQVEALAKKMETDFSPENKKLEADIQALQAQAPQMAADVRQQKVKELEGRRQAFQKKVQDRQAAIQAGLAASRSQVEKALGPILEKMMNERGANLLLDRGLVVLGDVHLDVTQTVIQRLNVALPKLTVTPIAPKPTAAAPKPPGG